MSASPLDVKRQGRGVRSGHAGVHDACRILVLVGRNGIQVFGPAGKDPDLSAPFVLPRGSTISEFALKLHRDFYDNLKHARVWGGADFDGMMVGRDYVLQDEDVVELKI